MSYDEQEVKEQYLENGCYRVLREGEPLKFGDQIFKENLHWDEIDVSFVMIPCRSNWLVRRKV
jgi:hypothetical protein